MGAWGPGLFDDDDAADLRAGYRLLLADAQSAEGATEAAVQGQGASLDRLEDDTAFWLALASIQWTSGRIDPRVRTAALKIIDDGLDLAKWSEEKTRMKRARVLEKLRESLVSPPPPAKPLPKKPPAQLADWMVGELVGHRMENGKYAVLHVVGHHTWSAHGARAPIVSVFNWSGERAPSAPEIAELTHLNHNGAPFTHHLHCLAMPKSQALKETQFERLGVTRPVTNEETLSGIYGFKPREGQTLERMLTKALSPYWRNPQLQPHMKKFARIDAGPEGTRADYLAVQRLLQGDAEEA